MKLEELSQVGEGANLYRCIGKKELKYGVYYKENVSVDGFISFDGGISYHYSTLYPTKLEAYHGYRKRILGRINFIDIDYKQRFRQAKKELEQFDIMVRYISETKPETLIQDKKE